jgi:histidine triad (HIT) family protein
LSTKNIPVEGCPFCFENGKIEVIAEAPDGYLVAALDSAGSPMPGCYLLIPKIHTESVIDLPICWQGSVYILLRAIPEVAEGRTDWNLNYNSGKWAGQRVPHTHGWVVFRSEEESESTRELGLATIVRRSREQE